MQALIKQTSYKNIKRTKKMSEQDPNPEKTKIEYSQHSKEELKAGIELGSDEEVVFNGKPNASLRRRGFTDRNGLIYEGTAIAVIRVGGVNTYEDVLVIGGSHNAAIGNLLLIPLNEGFIAKPLVAGEMTPIGRGVQEMKDLPDTVSRDHCAVGLNEQGMIVVENHNPTNETFLTVFDELPTDK